MWQLFALASLVSMALQSVTDKWAIVHARRIAGGVATFWRVGVLFVFTLIVGICGWLGPLHWYLDGWIFLFGIATVGSGFCYTYLLKRVEVTGIQAETYLMPLLFLAIDAVLLHTPLTAAQIAGVVLLTAGGFGFAIDGKTRRVKREFSLAVWLIFFYWVLYDGFEYYVFKYLHAMHGLNSVSFFASGLLIAVIVLLLTVLARGEYHLLFARGSARYVPGVAVGKVFDAASSLLYLVALSSAAVSQVTALGAIEPVLLFIVAVVAQKVSRVNIRERLDRANVRWKIFAIILISAGTLLVS